MIKKFKLDELGEDMKKPATNIGAGVLYGAAVFGLDYLCQKDLSYSILDIAGDNPQNWAELGYSFGATALGLFSLGNLIAAPFNALNIP